MTVEEYLRGVLAQVTKEFPEAGFILLAVEDHDDIEMRDLTAFTNMDAEEVEETLDRVQCDGEWSDSRPSPGRAN
jgi:hypothetical protein